MELKFIDPYFSSYNHSIVFDICGNLDERRKAIIINLNLVI